MLKWRAEPSKDSIARIRLTYCIIEIAGIHHCIMQVIMIDSGSSVITAEAGSRLFGQCNLTYSEDQPYTSLASSSRRWWQLASEHNESWHSSARPLREDKAEYLILATMKVLQTTTGVSSVSKSS